MSAFRTGICVLLGRPNVGKSTFMNAILKEEISIVTPKAQTTRDQVRGIDHTKQGQIVFVDTPGVHRARDGGINAYMIQEVKRALEHPDVILYLIDPRSKPEAELLILDVLRAASGTLLVAINKADQFREDLQSLPWIAPWLKRVEEAVHGSRCKWGGAFSISALKGDGVEPLRQRILNALPEGPPLYGTIESPAEEITDRSLRFVVAELIRKQLYLCLGDELPYSCAVEIESFREDQKPIAIQATLNVERDSQKGMVIGAKGKKIKEIGTEARKAIELLLDQKVFLELRVKVLPNWSSQPRLMNHLGYRLDQRTSRKSS